jgi:hypothetical protein
MLTKTDKEKILEDLGQTEWDVEQELLALNERVKQHDLPRLRIEHHEEGKHRFYIDFGESYMASSKQYLFLRMTEVQVIVFEEQEIRAFWRKDEDHPHCYAIDEKVLVADPVSKSCRHCRESIPGFGSCKPKVRLFVLPLFKKMKQPMILSLSPTSIRPWREHQLRLKRSGLPTVAVRTTLSLEDIQFENFRWAKAIVGIRGIASRDQLTKARQAYESIIPLRNRIGAQDYAEKGDRSES